MRLGLIILWLVGSSGCQSDKPDFSWGKAKEIVTQEVYQYPTALILPEDWEVRYKATSKGPEGAQRIYFKDDLVMWYYSGIPIARNTVGFRIIRTDTIIKRTPIVVELMTNDTLYTLDVYEWEVEEEYPHHYFTGHSNPVLEDTKTVELLHSYVLENIEKWRLRK